MEDCNLMSGLDMVSIIVPTYNSSLYIRDCVDSILNQTYIHWELLITDDCSTDNTLEILEEYQRRDKRIKVFRFECNKGAGAARNYSIERAGGRYIAFCDSDDWWYPRKLELQMKFMVENHYEFTYTDFETCDSGLVVTGISKKPGKCSYRNLCMGNNIGTPGVIYDTQRIGKVYMPAIRKRQDWALWIYLIRKTKYAFSMNRPLWKCRQTPKSLSSNKWSLVSYNIRIYTEVIGFSPWLAYLFFGFVFLPNHVLKIFRNKVHSYYYLKNEVK